MTDTKEISSSSSLEPDLVVAFPGNRDMVVKAKEHGIPVMQVELQEGEDG